MKNKFLQWRRVALACTLVAGGALAVDSPVIAAETVSYLAQSEALGLTVVAGNGVVSEQPSVGKLDVGAVDALSTPKVEKDFVLRNDRQAPITIGRLQPTCGCTSVLLGEGTETTKTLAPGEEVKVRMSVDVSRFHGPIHKAVRAYAADGATLLASMELDANIQDPVTLSTRQIDFGRLKFGDEPSFPLDITLSPRFATLPTPQLVSSSKDIIVTPIEVKTTIPAATQDAPKQDATAAAASAPPMQHYRVSLAKNAAIGPLNATLSLVQPQKSGALQTPEELLVSNALQTTMVAIVGEVVGKVSLTPRMVVFGKTQNTQEVSIKGIAPAQQKKVKVSSSNSFVKTRWITLKTTSADTSTLELSLDPKTPPGALEAQITVTAPDGERLILPVLAEISDPAPAPAAK